MQPEVVGSDTTIFPSTTSARIEEAPQVQSVRSRFAPVACAELSNETAASENRMHALKRSRWPQNPTAEGWQGIRRPA